MSIASNSISQTASFGTSDIYRIQNSYGYVDLGSSNAPVTSFYIDPITSLPISYTYYPIGPIPFYNFKTSFNGYLFDKNVVSSTGKFSSPTNELSLNFVTTGFSPTSVPIVKPALIIAKSNGKVGIGHISSLTINAKLDVTNNLDLVNTFKTTSVFTNDLQIANLFKVNRNNTKAIVVFNSLVNKNLFIVKGNGQTQIGEKTGNGKHADALLSVYGKVVSRSFYVTIDPALWADYVFEPNYKLKPLKELEKYYTLHKHLPDVPSANELSEADLNLAEMQALSMRKIEELTLYIVELNKKLELVKTEVEQLK